MSYDSRIDTYQHIEKVRGLLFAVAHDLLDRAEVHDASKLQEPELSTFDEYSPKLAKMQYGSAEYTEALNGMAPALKHHYAHNRHHPEHHPNGIRDMTLVDLVEMLCDWMAATQRHDPPSDINASIEKNAARFGYGQEIERLLKNTVVGLQSDP